jgi:cyclopropane fatty-acyl-phospholipid synthase-like methyltransferase
VTPEQTRAEVDFLVKLLGGAPKARVLDVPCGNGRHSLELAARGRRMTGVDLAEEFIEEARTQEDLRDSILNGCLPKCGNCAGMLNLTARSALETASDIGS